MKSKLTATHLIIYTLSFFTFWTVYNIFLRPEFETGTLGGIVLSELIKLASWTLPAVILILHFKGEMFITLSEMLSPGEKPRKNLIYTVGIALFMGACIIPASVIRMKRLGISESFNPAELIGTVLLVGITEEAVFRGFLLNALLKKLNPNFAMGISSLLFLAIHFPFWLVTGALSGGILFALGACLQVFILGVVFARSFISTRSLIYPVLLHMFWNLLIILLQ